MDREILMKELFFKTARSSGPGGQHVNKVSTKVILQFNLLESAGLSDEEKNKLKIKLQHKLTQDGRLVLSSDDSRSQFKNKELVIDRFFELIEKSLVVQKTRKPTKPSQISIQKRLEKKKIQSLKKVLRKKL